MSSTLSLIIMGLSSGLVHHRLLHTLKLWVERFRQCHLERCSRRACQSCLLCNSTRHFDDLARRHVTRICHDDHEPHTLWHLAKEHSRYRVRLASMLDGPTPSIICELDQHHVVFRDHRWLPKSDWTHGKRCQFCLQFLFRSRRSPRILRIFARFLQDPYRLPVLLSGGFKRTPLLPPTQRGEFWANEKEMGRHVVDFR